MTLPVLRAGVDELERLVNRHAGEQAPVIAIEATGGLHRAWTQELSRRFPDSVRLFAPSETAAARAQLGSRRFKTDDRDCAALTYLARQGHGRLVPADEHEALLSAAGSDEVCWVSERRPNSGCTTRSTGSARVCRRRSDMGASSSSPAWPDRRSWTA